MAGELTFDIEVMRIDGRDRFFTICRSDGYWVKTLVSKRLELARKKGHAFAGRRALSEQEAG